MKATRAHEEKHRKNIEDEINKQNRNTGLKSPFSSLKKCLEAKKRWGDAVDALIEREKSHGLGAPQPSESTFLKEYSAGRCQFYRKD